MRYLILFFLFGQSFFAQINFKVLDGFVTGSPEYSFIKAELINFNNDGSPEIAYYFKKDDNYLIKVRDEQGIEYFLYTGISDTGKTLENIELFNFNNLNYVALIYKFSDPPLINELKFSLKIIDIDNNVLVDSVEGYTGDYISDPYLTEINFHFLKVLESETGIRKILLGLKTIYEYTDIGETYGTDQYARTMIFNFNDSLYFSNSLNNSSNVFPLSKICYGYATSYASGVWGTSEGEDFRIYHLNDSGIITEGDEIFHYSSNNDSFNDFELLSSDDSTNYYLPIIIGGRGKLYAVSTVNGSIVWQHNLPIYFSEYHASANLSINDGNYIIYFRHYKMQIRKRENGQLVYDDPETSINPKSILETIDKKLYFIRVGGTQSIFLYEIDDSSTILSVENVSLEKPDEYFLNQNYPNPFNPNTTIKYQIPEINFVTLKVYDVLGNEVAILVNEEKPAGSFEVEFNNMGLIHQTLPSGIYFYQLRAGDYIETKKMILLK